MQPGCRLHLEPLSTLCHCMSIVTECVCSRLLQSPTVYPERQLHVPTIVSQGEDSCSVTQEQFWRQSVPQVPGTQAVVVVVEYKY